MILDPSKKVPDIVMYEYQVGGSLKVDAPSYIERQADRDLYTALKQGEFCYVFNARQTGKSSLRVHIKHRLQLEGYQCCVIDMTSIGSKAITPEQWYKSIASELWRGFNLLGQIRLRSWWQERESLSALQRLNRFIEDVILPVSGKGLYIFIDEIDSVLSLNFSIDDFFALIRFCYNQRAENPAYNRLTFALFGVSTPSQLIQDLNRTPFNIGRAIDLQGFQLQEALPLAEGFKGKVAQPQAVLAEILNWTGGQPFLTQKLCQLVVKSEQLKPESAGMVPSVSTIAEIVQTQIIQHWETNDQPEHLRTIRDRLLRNEHRVGRLLGLYQDILQGTVVTNESSEQMELLLSGLVVQQEGTLVVLNRIYTEVFNSAWVEKQLARLRPYSESLKGWVNSGCHDESRLLRGQALREAQDWAESHSLSEVDYQFLASSQTVDRREVQRALEAERLKEVEARLAEQKRSQKRLLLLMIASLALLVTTGLGIFAFKQYRRAALNEIRAISKSSEALFVSNRKLDALVEALRAWQKLQVFGQTNAQLQTQVEEMLWRTVYEVNEFNRLSGHQGGIFALAFSPDGKLLASGSSDKTAKIWSPDGRLLQTLTGYQDLVAALAWSPDGQLLVSASEDGMIKLWSRNARLLQTWQGHQVGIKGIVFSLDGERIVSGSEDNTLKIWTIDGQHLNTVKAHRAGIETVTFSPNGEILATAAEDNLIKLWRANELTTVNPRPIITLEGHGSGVEAVAFSPDGERFASASEDNTLKLWTKDGQLIKTLKGHSVAVNHVAFSPDGKMLISGSEDKTLKVWTKDGNLLTTLEGHNGEVEAVVFSPDSQIIASGSEDNTIRFWRANRTLLRTLEGHRAGITNVVFSPDGQKLATASGDTTVKLWQRDGQLLKVLNDHRAVVTAVAFSPDGQKIASASNDKTIKLWQANGKLRATLKGHIAGVEGVVFSSDGKFVASASEDKTVKLWDTETGQLLNTLEGHHDEVEWVSFSPDGQLLASASEDKTVKLWDTKTGKCLGVLEEHQDEVEQVVFSPDGQLLASASGDRTIKLWTRDGRLQHTLGGHWDRVNGVAFSPDGQVIASASGDKTIKLWTKDGQLLTSLEGHTAAVEKVAFSPDGQILASSSRDQTVILWDLERILDVEAVLAFGCTLIQDYLRTNVELSQSDRLLCVQLLKLNSNESQP